MPRAMCIWLGVFMLLGARTCLGQTVATVNGEAIDRAEVDSLLQESIGKRTVTAEAKPALQAHALEQAIERHLVALAMRREKNGASDEQIAAAIDAFTGELKSEGQTLADFLQQAGLTAEQLRRKVYWQTSWQRMLATTLTEEKLRECFEEHRASLDGTKVRVSHLLRKVSKDAPPSDRAKILREITALGEQIAAGTLKFDAAVEQFSEGTKTQGGDLGFILRHGSMPESFAAAAFALKPGDVSPPVATPAGFHLILCREIAPGTKKLADVRRDVELLAAQELFAEIVARERPAAKIEYVGNYPHFRPGTRELAP